MYVYITVFSYDGRGVRFYRDVCLLLSVRTAEEWGFTGMCVYITVVSEDGRGVRFYRDVCLHYCCQ